MGLIYPVGRLVETLQYKYLLCHTGVLVLVRKKETRTEVDSHWIFRLFLIVNILYEYVVTMHILVICIF